MAVNVIDTIKPKGEFPVVEAVDVDVNGEKLTEVLDGLATAEDLENVAQLVIDKADKSELEEVERVVDLKADKAEVDEKTDDLQTQIDNIVTGVPAEAEVLQARGGYSTLNERLTQQNADLQEDIRQLTNYNNVFNSETTTDGMCLNGAGNPNADASCFISDYIEVEAGIKYKRSHASSDTKHRTAFYNKNKQSMNAVTTDGVFVALEGAKYIRFSGYLTEKSTTTFTEYSAQDIVARKSISEENKNIKSINDVLQSVFVNNDATNISTIGVHVKGSGNIDLADRIQISTDLANYDTYYCEISNDVYLYFENDTDVPYLSICTGESFSGITTNSGGLLVNVVNAKRYRKSENNLPTVSSPAYVKAGGFIAVTITANSDAKIYGLSGNSYRLNDEIKADVIGNTKEEAVSEAVDVAVNTISNEFVESELGLVLTPNSRFDNFYDGQYGTVNGLQSLETYISYGIKLTKDTDIYVNSCNDQYFSICIYPSEAMQNGVRYRKQSVSEDTLPYESNPVNATAGQVVLFTTRKDNKNFAVTFADYAASRRFKNGIFLSSDQMEQVASALTEKHCHMKYRTINNSSLAIEAVEVYIPSRTGYIRYDFFHNRDEGRNADIWRIDNAYYVDNSFNEVKTLTANGEWEIALHLANRPDFSGGIMHGDEVKTNVVFIVDGKNC